MTATAFTGCQKSELDVYETLVPEARMVSVDVAMNSADTRLEVYEDGDLWKTTWQKGDRMGGWSSDAASDQTYFNEFSLTEIYDDNGLLAGFSGLSNGNYLRLVFPFDEEQNSISSGKYNVSFDDQIVDVSNSMTHLDYYMYMISDGMVNVSEDSTAVETPTMKQVGAMLDINLTFTNLVEANEYDIFRLELGGGEGCVEVPTTGVVDLLKKVDDEDFMTSSNGVITVATSNYPTLTVDANTATVPVSIIPFDVAANEKIQVKVYFSLNDTVSFVKTIEVANTKGSDVSFARAQHHYLNVECDITGAEESSEWEGLGTQESPYLIANRADLALIAKSVSDGTQSDSTFYKQVCDIDLGGSEFPWTPIGESATLDFTGIYDGDGYQIANLYISSTGGTVGLFGQTDATSVIRNVNLSGYVSGTTRVGGLVGYSYGTVDNCSVDAQVVASSSYSGIVLGCAYTNTVSNCVATGSITANGNYCGGVVGYGSGVTIISCTNYASVTGTGYLGGVVGSASSSAGCGYSNLVNYGDVTGSSTYVGGIQGYVYTNVLSNSFNTGNVTGTNYVGGITGRVYSNGSVMNCYTACEVTGTGTYVGLAIGQMYSGIVYDCYYQDLGSDMVAVANGEADVTVKTLSEMQSADFIDALNSRAAAYNALTDAVNNNTWAAQSGVNEGRPVPSSLYAGKTSLFESGDGSAASPYIIKTAEQMSSLAMKVNNFKETQAGLYFELGGDVDLGGQDSPWSAIGTSTSILFDGDFNGAGYTISGMYIAETTTSYQGLFGYLGTNSNLYNLTVEGEVNGKDYASGIAGYSKGLISDCVNKANVNGQDYLGGIAGYYYGSGVVSNCVNYGTITSDETQTASSYVGGLIGRVYYGGGSLDNAVNYGTVIGNKQYTGGIVGSIENSASRLVNSTNNGSISGIGYVAGIVGYVDDATVANVVNHGSVTATGTYAGGVIGKVNTAVALNLYNTAVVSSSDNSTGLIAAMNTSSTLEFTYSVSSGSLTGVYDGYDAAELMDLSDMKTSTFIDKLNYGAGFYNGMLEEGALSAKSWVLDASVTDGYPSFDFDNDAAKVAIFSNGEGTQSSPYQLGSLDDLNTFRMLVGMYKTFDGTYFELSSDIDAGGEQTPWASIGSSSTIYFNGYFDGGNHTVKNVYLNSSSSYQGFFGYTGTESVVTNLNVQGDVTGSLYTGGVVGESKGVVNNCSFSGSVTGTGTQITGGVVGRNYGTVINCSNYASVSGSKSCGGVAGFNMANSIIRNSYNRGSISGTSNVGGVIGTSAASSIIQNCYNTGSVEGTTYLGGISGYKYTNTIDSSYYLVVEGLEAIGYGATEDDVTFGMSETEMQADSFVTTLNDYAYQINLGLPEWSTVAWVKDADSSNGGYPELDYNNAPSSRQ